MVHKTGKTTLGGSFIVSLTRRYDNIIFCHLDNKCQLGNQTNDYDDNITRLDTDVNVKLDVSFFLELQNVVVVGCAPTTSLITSWTVTILIT